MQLMYGTIIRNFESSVSILVCLLASVVYHGDWLIAVSVKKAGHPFSAIPLLQNPLLLARLKAKFTILPSPLMSQATGICSTTKSHEIAFDTMSNYTTESE